MAILNTGNNSSNTLSTGQVDNVGPRTEAVVWSLVAASAVFLGLRLYCKWHQSRKWWWDDHTLAISWVSACFPSRENATGKPR
jgi:hypothetical protein